MKQKVSMRRLWLASVFLAMSLAFYVSPFAFSASSSGGRLVNDVVHCRSLEGNLLGDSAERKVIVYLPPSYDEHPSARYPAVYLLHGSGDSPTKFTDGDDPYYQNFHIKPAMDELVALGNAREMIFVMPDAGDRFGGSWYNSSKTIGDYEACISQELVNYIDTKYRTIAQRDSRGIAGYSMGGYGAMHLALKYPDRFGAVVSMSGHYDRDYAWKSRLQAAALVDPKDWDELSKLGFLERSGFAIAAGISPNPDKPPFFVDLPFKYVNGVAQPVPELWDLYAKADIIHGDLARYLQKAQWLNGILIVHGAQDIATALVDQARALDQQMTDLGIEHTYWEHDISVDGDGHIFIGRYPERWLQFFAQALKP